MDFPVEIMKAELDWSVALGSAKAPCILAARLTVCGLIPDFYERKYSLIAGFVNFVLSRSPSEECVTLETEANRRV